MFLTERRLNQSGDHCGFVTFPPKQKHITPEAQIMYAAVF